MGSGIALVALYQGYTVILQDAFPGALEKAQEHIEKFLAKKELSSNYSRITYTQNLDDLSPSNIVIEAIIEDIEIKRALFEKLDHICPIPAILASNTSTLAVTAIAASVSDASRVAGMHFFNPAPVLPLVEVVCAAETSQETIDFIVALAEDLGKTAVVTGDTPGFIVNRVARPFYGEALRLLGEGVASFEEIDIAMQVSAGFRMGPFRLMDLIGIDINTTAMKSMYEQTFGELRYRPHWIQMQKLQAGTLGRKTGRGFYTYGDGTTKIELAEIPSVDGGRQVILMTGGSWAPGLRELCEEAGYIVGKVTPPDKSPLLAMITEGKAEGLREQLQIYDAALPTNVPILVQASEVTVAEICTWVEKPERIIGFDGLFIANGPVATLVPSPVFDTDLSKSVESFLHALGSTSLWISDSPALLLPRIIFMLINEASFAVLDGVAKPDTIDLAMQLGVNYPKGLLAWGREIGLDKVVTVLDHLRAEYGEERYRTSSLLRRWVRESEIHRFV